jgi:hypothetical protein
VRKNFQVCMGRILAAGVRLANAKVAGLFA